MPITHLLVVSAGCFFSLERNDADLLGGFLIVEFDLLSVGGGGRFCSWPTSRLAALALDLLIMLIFLFLSHTVLNILICKSY